MLKSVYINIFFYLSLTSCNYFDYSRKDKDILIKKRINEIKANGLGLYPKIAPCKNIIEKRCFETQLISELKKNIQETLDPKKITITDTIWLTIEISKTGIIHLKTISKTANLNIKEAVEYTFENISPIEPATIQGVKVTSNFKIPLTLKTVNN